MLWLLKYNGREWWCGEGQTVGEVVRKLGITKTLHIQVMEKHDNKWVEIGPGYKPAREEIVFIADLFNQ